jgi:hypothetical protein
MALIGLQGLTNMTCFCEWLLRKGEITSCYEYLKSFNRNERSTKFQQLIAFFVHNDQDKNTVTNVHTTLLLQITLGFDCKAGFTLAHSAVA